MKQLVLEVKKCIKDALEPHKVELEDIRLNSETKFGDLSSNICLELGEKLKKNPLELANSVKEKMKLPEVIERVEVVNGYLNLYFNRARFSKMVLEKVLKEKERYGRQNLGKNKVIVIDMSSPNIAKPMNVGHLRSTIIGDSLYKILKFLGFKCISDNHLGDWGTQFGKLIYAYKTWGKLEKLEKEPIKHLLELYIKFHEEEKKDPRLESYGRLWFKKLEEGDKEARKLWKTFYDLSIRSFNEIYKRLGVKFDYALGESFYERMLKDVVKECLEKGIAEKDQGAVVIRFKEEGWPPLIILKKDGATTYETRELATIKYRKETFKFYKALYVVGSEQKLKFMQDFKAAELLGYAKKDSLEHIYFGMLTLPGGKMSTRAGRVLYLEELLNKARELALRSIKKKNPSLCNKEEVADKIGVGAIKYFDLSRNRIKDISFDWKKALSFEGNSGPYLQYSHARASSILRKGNFNFKDFKFVVVPEVSDLEFELIKRISEFEEKIEAAGKLRKPNILANYLNNLCELFNTFYHKFPVLKAGNNLRGFRLGLVCSFKIVLFTGLNLLGIEPLEEM